MPDYIIQNTRVYFRQSNMPVQWMPAMSQLGVFVTITNDKRYPYFVELSESEFLSLLDLAEEL